MKVELRCTLCAWRGKVETKEEGRPASIICVMSFFSISSETRSTVYACLRRGGLVALTGLSAMSDSVWDDVGDVISAGTCFAAFFFFRHRFNRANTTLFTASAAQPPTARRVLSLATMSRKHRSGSGIHVGGWGGHAQ